MLQIKGAGKEAHKNARLVIEQAWGSKELHELAISAWRNGLISCAVVLRKMETIIELFK